MPGPCQRRSQHRPHPTSGNNPHRKSRRPTHRPTPARPAGPASCVATPPGPTEQGVRLLTAGASLTRSSPASLARVPDDDGSVTPMKYRRRARVTSFTHGHRRQGAAPHPLAVTPAYPPWPPGDHPSSIRWPTVATPLDHDSPDRDLALFEHMFEDRPMETQQRARRVTRLWGLVPVAEASRPETGRHRAAGRGPRPALPSLDGPASRHASSNEWRARWPHRWLAHRRKEVSPGHDN
jgi:hypothetical protein